MGRLMILFFVFAYLAGHALDCYYLSAVFS